MSSISGPSQPQTDMLKSIQDFIRQRSASESEADNTQKLQLAAAALMFEVIASDGVIENSELEALRLILGQQFDLSAEQIDELYADAQRCAKDATDLHKFTRTICDNWDNEQRLKLLENMWQLSLADDSIDTHERHLVRKVGGLLHLTEAQIIRSRENARLMLQNAAAPESN